MPFENAVRKAASGSRWCQSYGGGSSRLLFHGETGCFTPGDLKELFDKHVFLYYEEKILGQKLKQMGLKELLVTDAYYVHAHSVSIDKAIQRIRIEFSRFRFPTIKRMVDLSWYMNGSDTGQFRTYIIRHQSIPYMYYFSGAV